MPRRPRILVFVSPDHLHDGCLERAAEIAGAQDAVVLLAAVGEVPETALHAAEERDALVRMLGRAAHPFGERVSGTCIEMGGDPVHGLAELVAESRPDVVVLPHETHRPPGGTDLAQALGRHMDIPVLQVTRDSSGGRHPRPGAVDRGALRGGPKMALDCGWVELIPVDEHHSVGRAHLFLNGMPVHLEPWCGQLDSLRPAMGVAEVRPGRYILRFASGLQNIPVDVDVADGRINVHGHYHDVPASLAELSEGE